MRLLMSHWIGTTLNGTISHFFSSCHSLKHVIKIMMMMMMIENYFPFSFHNFLLFFFIHFFFIIPNVTEKLRVCKLKPEMLHHQTEISSLTCIENNFWVYKTHIHRWWEIENGITRNEKFSIKGSNEKTE